MRTVSLTAVVPLLALTVPLAAQQAKYRFAPHDTVRYHETTERRIELKPPRGPVTLTSRHEATIALAAQRGDSVAAWYEELALSSGGPQGVAHPATDAALRLPFRLVVQPTGQVTTVAAPTFSAEISSQADLSQQFEDFFIALPASTLRPAATWADTIEVSSTSSPEETNQSRHIRRYRVLRDTVVGNLKAVVIAVGQDITVRSSSPMKNAGVTITTRLAGTEEGTAVFAPASGRLLSRDRRGRLSGEQLLKGEGREMTVPITLEYSSSLASLGRRP